VKPKLSIVICTRDRCSSLIETLESISLQVIPALMEVIVVDNASSDETKSTVLKFTKKHKNLNIRYIYEKNIGLSIARNKGISEAKGEILAFIDDDAIPDNKWSLEILRSFKDKKISAVGGQVNLKYLEKKPMWVTDKLEIYLSKLVKSNKKIIEPPDYIVGANMAFRLSALKKTNGFSSNFGRIDKRLLSFEEIELLRRVKGIILYNPNMKVIHKVMGSRLTFRYFIVRAFWQGVSEARLDFIYGRPKSLDKNFSLKLLLERWVRALYKPVYKDTIEIVIDTIKYISYLLESNRISFFSKKSYSTLTMRPKERTEGEPMPPIKRVSSGGIVLNRKNNILLLYKRSTGEYLIPNGEVIEGETLEQTAVREILEETGYKTVVVRKIDVSEYTYTWDDGRTYHKKEHHFLLILEDQRKRSSKRSSHEDYTNKWVSLNEAVKLVTYKDARECLGKLRHILQDETSQT